MSVIGRDVQSKIRTLSLRHGVGGLTGTETKVRLEGMVVAESKLSNMTRRPLGASLGRL